MAAKVGVYYRAYAPMPLQQPGPNGQTYTYNSTDRSDVAVEGGLLVEYRVLDWLAFNVSGTYSADFTNFNVTAQANNLSVTRDMNFQQFEVLGGVRFSY